jgi:hypothetical protein
MDDMQMPRSLTSLNKIIKISETFEIGTISSKMLGRGKTTLTFYVNINVFPFHFRLTPPSLPAGNTLNRKLAERCREH